MVDASKRAYQLHSGAVEDGTLQVAAYHAIERISGLYRIEMDLMSSRPDLDGEAILAADVWFAVKQPTVLSSGKRGVQLLQVHGVLASFEQHGKGDEGTRYRAVLMPRLWRLSLTSQCRIFQDLNVIDIVKQVLKDHGFEPEDSDFRTNGRTYPVREYVVQYRESDLAFISRLLEHEGIFYHFEHNEKRSMVVFGDAPEGCTKVVGAASFIYRTQVGGTRGEDAPVEESVFEMTVLHRPVIGQVVLGDYNYRTPEEPMYPEAPVDATASFGELYEYGDHFKDEDEGAVLANLRAEEIACRKRQFRGISDARGFRAGGVFTLKDHYRADVNMDHLILEANHHGSQGFATAEEDDHPTATYSNDFITIPAATIFRPRRVTPKPVVVGTITAKVDAAGDGQYAELDDQGRYKLKFPFDRSDLKDGKASRFVRMAQPYGGNEMGIHFPLHKGTEVIVTHINGDPDRPIIAAAVPNPQTATLVTSENQTQSIIRTGGGNSITIEDTADAEGFTVNATLGYTVSIGKDSSTTVGNNETHSVTADRTLDVKGNNSESVNGNVTQTIKGNLDQKVTGTRTMGSTGDASDTISGARSTKVTGSDSTTVTGEASISADGKVGINSSASVVVGAPEISVNGDGKVTIKVGGSSITIDGGGITIDAPKITIKGGAVVDIGATAVKAVASGACEVGGATVDIKASGPISLNGAMVKNNA